MCRILRMSWRKRDKIILLYKEGVPANRRIRQHAKHKVTTHAGRFHGMGCWAHVLRHSFGMTTCGAWYVLLQRTRKSTQLTASLQNQNWLAYGLPLGGQTDSQVAETHIIVMNLCRLALGGQMVKKLRLLASKFELDQSQRKSTKVAKRNASASACESVRPGLYTNFLKKTSTKRMKKRFSTAT